jgi:transketolase
VYLRLSRAGVGALLPDDHAFEIGRGFVLREGRACTLVSTGALTATALEAAERLAARGIAVRVLHLPTVKPLDKSLLRAAAAEAAPLFTIEEHSIIGGLGEAVAGLLAETDPVPVHRLGLCDTYGESGPYEALLDKHGLTAPRIAERVERTLRDG